MATNPYFDNYNYGPEQDLIEDLIIESIQMFGVNNHYISRSIQAVDPVLREDDLSIFDVSFVVEMYVKSSDAYEGDGGLFSKFGVEFRDQVTFSVSIKAFDTAVDLQVPSWKARIPRPKEGDLIYCPVTKSIYEIVWCNKEALFFQAGKLHLWDIKCERFELSNERFQTGVAVIDEFYSENDYSNVTDIDVLSDFDPFANNKNIQDESDDILDFSTLSSTTPNGRW